MKKLLVITILLLSATSYAQVYEGLNMHNGLVKKSYSILSNQDSKSITADLQSFLGKYGKVTKPEKDVYRVQNLKGTGVSADLSVIDVVSKSSKRAEKLEFFFLNDANNSLNNFEMKNDAAVSFVQAFLDFTNHNLEVKLVAENLSIAEDALKEAKKDVNKVEKSIASNLKEQQKLGKKLDASPELMAQALSEKEDIVTQLYSDDSTSIADEKLQADLSKASQKKDKEISKIKKDTKKAEDKLSKKEDELETLKSDLEMAKRLVKGYERALLDAQNLANKVK